MLEIWSNIARVSLNFCLAPETCPNFTLSLSEYCRMSPGFGSNNNLLPEFCPNFAEFQAFTVLGG